MVLERLKFNAEMLNAGKQNGGIQLFGILM